MTTVSKSRLKDILWLRLTTNKSQEKIGEELGISRGSVNRSLRDQIPNLNPQERRELLISLIQRSRDKEFY